ncbi:hypothetical protein [Flavobacterium sp.]|uniref:hypothetical protein n=1 Tax=Flavobacterium sp. TaxID=239 RepID=UPI0026212293|nr:hypothetical protein [Flavobacterium sp.]
MKNRLFTYWPVMRIVRLAFAGFVFANAYETRQWIFVPIGLFFLLQAVFNWGCGIQGNCAVNYKKESHE